MRTMIRCGVLAAAVAWLSLSTASAQVRITSLVVSPSEDPADAADVYAGDTRLVHAIFDYEGLSDETVTVTVEGRGIIELFATGSRFSGEGRAVVPLTGAGFYQSVAAQLPMAAREAQQGVNRAASQEIGLQEYLSQIKAMVYRMQAILDYIAELPLDAEARDAWTTADVAVSQMDLFVTTALNMPIDDVARRQAKAEQMKRPARTIVQSADQLQAASEGATDVPIAPTGDEAEYTVIVSINNLPSVSTSFRVRQSGLIYLPRISR